MDAEGEPGCPQLGTARDSLEYRAEDGPALPGGIAEFPWRRHIRPVKSRPSCVSSPSSSLLPHAEQLGVGGSFFNG